MSTNKHVDAFYNRYQEAGFHFPTSVLTTYTLSLHTKPFVLLTGISGTGKTKIAQLFPVLESSEEEIEVPTAADQLIIKVPRIFDRFNFPKELLPTLLTEDELEEFDKNAEEYRQRNDGGNFTETYILTVEDEFGEFQIGVYGQRASSPLVRGRFYKSNQDNGQDYDAREHLTKYYKVGDVLKLEKIGEKRFRVVSVNDKTTVKKMNAYELSNIKCHCFIPVRSDWTDNSELFGFYNLIEQKYHIPTFLEFILTAINNPEYPFFVLFDEMNLSKVEHYFSDVLSCLESRLYDNGELKQEKIVLHNGLDQLTTDSEVFEHIPNSIEIPPNLYITGTVNIDESTYMFSPKVLDRANVIEFNEVNLVAYGDNTYEDNTSYKLTSFPDFTHLTLATKSVYERLPSMIKEHLVAINDILKKYNLHFGYRTANEVALYIQNAMAYIDENSETQLAALDHQLVQKIFPKLNGSYAMLEAPLNEVLLYLSGEKDVLEITPESTSFPKSTSKLQAMYKKLSINGYTSFID